MRFQLGDWVNWIFLNNISNKILVLSEICTLWCIASVFKISSLYVWKPWKAIATLWTRVHLHPHSRPLTLSIFAHYHYLYLAGNSPWWCTERLLSVLYPPSCPSSVPLVPRRCVPVSSGASCHTRQWDDGVWQVTAAPASSLCLQAFRGTSIICIRIIFPAAPRWLRNRDRFISAPPSQVWRRSRKAVRPSDPYFTQTGDQTCFIFV